MKKQFYAILIFLIIPFGLSAQFEGQILFQVDYSSPDEKLQEMSTNLPKKSKLTLKGEKALFEQTVAGGGRQAIYTNSETNESTLLMALLGNAYKVELNEENLQQIQQTEKLTILERDETKEIQGYKCRKALAISGNDTLVVYYTPQLSTKASFPPFSNIKGLPLEYELVRGNIRMHYLAVSVKETAVDDTIFDIDPSIKEIKFEDFARTFAIKL